MAPGAHALTEGLSRLYECSLILAHPLPAPAAELAVRATHALEMSRGAGGRNVCGLVRRVESLGGTTGSYGFVRVVIVPELWTLSLRQNSRVWQNLSVATIVREVLRDANVYRATARSTSPARCSRSRRASTAFNTVRPTSRSLCRPSSKKRASRSIFATTVRKSASCSPSATIDGRGFPTLDGSALAVTDDGAATASTESVQWLDAHRQLRPAGSVLRDYDFTRPDATLGA